MEGGSLGSQVADERLVAEASVGDQPRPELGRVGERLEAVHGVAGDGLDSPGEASMSW